jgi:phenylalanyl-tRNA synthetase alpha chain
MIETERTSENPVAGCSYSDELGKWMEVGNSGMFRPEMLRPMGLPEDVSVIAWGLSLER